MCGIAGMVARRGSGPPGRARLDAAIAALRHRGPDGSGAHLDGPCLLGHTRLSIIDLAGGAQPLGNEDGTVVVSFNGEIWNHVDLRRELEAAGHAFRTRSDTEVLVHGFEEWGDGLLERLNGMFAFAVWDGRHGRLLLARDRVGKKPLYLVETPDGLAFGSDARTALLVGGVEPRIDASLVPQYLFQRYVVSPGTLLAGVRKLRPGHLATYDGERLVERAWWTPPVAPVEPLGAGELRALLRDAVEKRLMSDVPLGVLLSGGIDSCGVLGLMREAGARDVASFTIGFADPVFDERRYARIAAERNGTEHHEVVVDTGSFLDTLPRLAWARDEPMSEPSEIPLLLLAEFAGQHVKVALTGDGGDELFGGYPKYRADRLLRAGGLLAGLGIAAAGRLLALRRSHRRLGARPRWPG
ncbi:MAG: asparagine synthase (glutamine-hydrolyzing) [Thermoleophilia bacterium]